MTEQPENTQFAAAIAEFPDQDKLKARMSFIHADGLTHDEAKNMVKWLTVRILSQELYYKQLISHRWFNGDNWGVPEPPQHGNISA